MLKKRPNNFWIRCLIIGTILLALNGTVTRILVNSVDPLTMASIRYIMASVVLFPVLVLQWRKHRSAIKQNYKLILAISVIVALGEVMHVTVISTTNASFPAILNMLTPIIFVIFSLLLTRDRIDRRSLIGLLSAILGGVIVVVLPALTGSNFGNFGWLPVSMNIIFVLSAAFWPIYLRKFNEKGVPIFSLLFFSYVVLAVVLGLLALFAHGAGTFSHTFATTTPWHWALIAFLGIFVSALYSALNTKAYENIGTASIASVSYLHYFLAVLFPVILLHEVISWEMMIGVLLIMTGIFLTSHKQYYHWRHDH
jgi:drug/metabolite transporter (DMT)-like permease